MKSLIFLMAITSQMALAQTTSETPSATATPSSAAAATPTEPPKTLKKIVVTGSYIKKAPDAKAPTPVTVTDKSKVQETSTFTVSGAFVEDPGFSNGPADVFLQLHGQTEADNLVLMNGLRLPKTAGGSGVNIDFIPALVLERTETLKDGASALYGSEALSGVVNIVTNRDYEGTQFMYRLSSPQKGGGQQANIGVMNGGTIGKHHYLAAFQFRHDTPLRTDDDPHSRIVNLIDQNAGGDPYAAGVLIGDAGLGTANCPAGHLDADGFCRSDIRSQLATEDRNYYMTYVNYGYDFSDTLKFNSLLSYTKRSWMDTGAAPVMQFANETALGRPDYSIPVAIANNSWGTNPSGYAANPQLLYRATEELGTTITKRDVDNYVAQAELTKSLGNWDVQLATGYGFTFFRDVTLQGNADKSKVFNLIQTNQFNPFKPSGSKDDIRSTAYQSWFQHTSDILNPKVIVTGPLTNWLNMAVGVESQFQSFKYGYDPLTQRAGGTLTASSVNQQGSREVYSGFMELAFVPFKQLEIQLAGRFDEYSDFGSTVNPKLGIAYRPIDSLTIRGSYGTGFKAPDLLSIYQGRSTNPTRFRDEVQCKKSLSSTDCTRGIWSVTREGNKNLDPETAQHFNFGAIVTPNPSVTFGADYWHVDGEDGLSDISPTAVTLAERDGFNLGQYGIVVNREPGTDKITSMYIPARVNAGIFRIRGLDLLASKRTTYDSKYFGPIGVAFTMNHSHIISSQGRDFEIEAIRGEYNLNWNNIVGVSFTKENNFLKFQARTQSGGDEDSDEVKGIGKGSTSVITAYDVHYERFLKKDSSFHAGIKNLLDTHPTAEVDGTRFVYGPGPGFTRTFYMGYTKEF